MIVALRAMATGKLYQEVDEHSSMFRTSACENLHFFMRAIIVEFRRKYMRAPEGQNYMRSLSINMKKGFPGCIGGSHFRQWERKTALLARLKYSCVKKRKLTVFKAVANGDLWS